MVIVSWCFLVSGLVNVAAEGGLKKDCSFQAHLLQAEKYAPVVSFFDMARQGFKEF